MTPEEIQRRVSVEFLKMKQSIRFRNLNQKEQDAIRDTMIAAMLGVQGEIAREKMVVRQAPSESNSEMLAVMKEIKEILLRSQGVVHVDSPYRGVAGATSAAGADGEDAASRRIAEALVSRSSSSGMRTNLPDVPIEKGSADGVGSAVERLRKISGASSEPNL